MRKVHHDSEGKKDHFGPRGNVQPIPRRCVMDYSVQATLGKRMIIVCSLFACHYSKWLVTTNNVTLISLASDGCFGFNGAWWYLAVPVVKYAAKSNPCARNMAGRSAMHLRSSETLRKFVPCPRSRRRMEGVDGNSGHPMTPRNYPKLVFDHGVWLEELACMYNVLAYIIYIYIYLFNYMVVLILH